MRTILLAVILAVAPYLLTAQRMELGVVGGASLNMHSASFTQLGSFASCCPEFSGGTAWGPYGGLFIALPLDGGPAPKWRLHGRLIYSADGATMSYDEQSFVADLRDTAKVVPAVFTHDLDASISSIGLEPLVSFRPFGALDLMLGGRIAFVTTAHFVQTETLTEPADFGSYLGTDRTWVNHDADIPNASSLSFGLVGGLRYTLPLNTDGTFFLAPELTYNLGLTNVAEGVDWKISQLRAGIAIGWMPRESGSPPPIDTFIPPPPPVIVAVPPAAEVGIDIMSSGSDGVMRTVDTVRIDDTRIIDYLPVLGHVYFEEGSDVVPPRYYERNTVKTDTLSDSDVAVHSLLAIVARRMRDNPTAKAELVGSTSNTDGDNDLALAERRANNVLNILVGLGISPDRLKVSARRLPKLPTTSSLADEKYLADEENRRVEIFPTEARILDPVTLTNIRSTIQPTSAVAEYTIKTTVAQVDTAIRMTLGGAALELGNSPSILTRSVDLRPFAGTLSGPIIASISVEDSLGRTATAQDTVPVKRVRVEQKQAERSENSELERYSLILFRFDDASITTDHERQLERIRARMREGAKVRIIGMTDLMGKSAYNLDLSRKRAQSVARSLGLPDSAIEAVGSSAPRFGNNSPEGRAYNRTVIIEVTRAIR